MTDLLLVLLAYLIGSIPTGVMISRLAGIDVRSVGSGNIGATNVTRAAGSRAGVLTLIGDVGKGAAAVGLGSVLGASSLAPQVAGLAALFGHAYSVFLRFSGGKGVATGFGVCVALAPGAMILPLAVFVATFAATRIVSVASLAGAFATPVAMALFGAGRANVVATIVLALLIAARHHDNIWRLRDGLEPRFRRRDPEGSHRSSPASITDAEEPH